MALILVITCEGRMNAGFRRQVRAVLHAGFFIVRNDIATVSLGALASFKIATLR